MQGADSSKTNPKAAIAAKRRDHFRVSLAMTSEWFAKLRSQCRSRGPSSPILGRAIGTPFSSGASKVEVRASGPMASAIGPVFLQWLSTPLPIRSHRALA